MMYMVIFKCTRSERDGRGPGLDPMGGNLPAPLDCYMVANKMFETVPEARRYADSLPLSRQGRVVDVIQFRCPKTGEWKPSWGDDQRMEFVEALVDEVGGELGVDTGHVSPERMRSIVHRLRCFIEEYEL